MTSFVAVYRGKTISEAKMIAVSGNPALVAHVASELLDDPFCLHDAGADPVLIALNQGRRKALRLVKEGAR
jgi:hypothetical protein